MKKVFVFSIVMMFTYCIFKNSYSKIGITDILTFFDRFGKINITDSSTITYRYPIGELDLNFGPDKNGKVLTSIGGPIDQANAIAIQGDGKIVVAGVSNNDFAIVRYNPDGSLDTSFDDPTDTSSTPGIVIRDISGSNTNDQANAVAIQGDGKIVVAGVSNNDFAIVRYNPTGSLDTSFDGDGIKTTNIGGPIDQANAIAIQGDGKIVVAGVSNNDFAIVRYNPTGSLDTSFGRGAGIITLDVKGGDDRANAIALQALQVDPNTYEIKIVVAGYADIDNTPNNTDYDFAVVRYK